jgi:predicted dehydrogenase/threonine dehydrogenase-like Zn-dependent dehydrogenase
VARRLRDGRLELVEVPEPRLSPGSVAVRLEASVLSAGTERATLDVARKSLLAKALARPEQARAVVRRALEEGIGSTVSVVRQRLDELGPLGYSASGVVIEAGSESRGLAAGDRVAVAGGGMANHAEMDMVPALLCARLPDDVSFEEGAFTTLGAIALNGFRQAGVQVGSTVAVIGLGLVGQLAVRMARAAGCRVLGTDLRPQLVELARRAGAHALPRPEIGEGSRWVDSVDAVLVCAATQSRDPALLAASLARDRGTIVIVGDVRMDLPRAPFYEKELELRLARSYGPGRYDPAYELHGFDYPIGQVRWTEQRNMAAFLDLVEDRAVLPGDLITHRFPFSEAEQAFAALRSAESVVGIVLRYEGEGHEERPQGEIREEGGAAARRTKFPQGEPGFALVGPGSFATSTIVPGLVRAGLKPIAVASSSGLSAEGARRQFGFASAHSDPREALACDGVQLAVIATHHDSHAALTAAALEAGLAVYVEKPLALDWDELAQVVEAQRRAGAPLVVGFNRRYAPLAAALRALASPRLMAYRVNAGPLAADHWTNDLRRGGGRLKGEGCHFIDFLCDQAGADPVTARALGFPSSPDLPLAATDNFSVQIAFADGGVGTVHYASDSPPGPGKERFETSAPGAYAVIDDYRSGEIWVGRNRRRLGGRRRDKGHQSQFEQLAKAVRGEADYPDPGSFYLSTIVALAAARSLETGNAERVLEYEPAPAKCRAD